MAVLIQVLLVACASLAYGFTFSKIFLPALMFALLLAWSPLAAIPVAALGLASIPLAAFTIVIPDIAMIVITCLWALVMAYQGRLLSKPLTNPDAASRLFSLTLFWGRVNRAISIMLLLLLLVRGINPIPPILGFLLFFLTSHDMLKGKKTANPWTWRSIFATSVILLISVVFSVIILEFGTRLLPNAPPKLIKETNIPHPRRIFMRIPNDKDIYHIENQDKSSIDIPFTTNHLALCDREYGPKASDEFRIVMIGDSYIEGLAQPEPERITRQIEQQLNSAHLPQKITVINAGIGGYGPWQERDLLQELGFTFEPDLVILQLFMGNDIENTLAKSGKLLQSYQPLAQAFLARFRYQELGPVRADKWLYAHSALYRRSSTISQKPSLIADMFNTFRFLPPCRIPSPPRSIGRNCTLEPNLCEWYPDLEDGWAQMKDDIRGIRLDCKERGIGFIVFDIPCQQIIIDSDWQVVMDTSTSTPNLYDRDKCEHLVDAFCREEGIPFIPLIAPLRNQSNREELYHHFDGHLTSRGARISAETIAQFLLDGPYLTHK